MKRDENISQVYKELINLGGERRDGQVRFIVRFVPSVAVQHSEWDPYLTAACALASP